MQLRFSRSSAYVTVRQVFRSLLSACVARKCSNPAFLRSPRLQQEFYGLIAGFKHTHARVIVGDDYLGQLLAAPVGTTVAHQVRARETAPNYLTAGPFKDATNGKGLGTTSVKHNGGTIWLKDLVSDAAPIWNPAVSGIIVDMVGDGATPAMST